LFTPGFPWIIQNMEFPLWAVFALLCAGFSALVLIIPERAKCDGFALAFWNKVAALVFMVPFVLWQGLPGQWEFYALVAAQACLWVVSDVIFFRALPKVGAGVVSRILPMSVIVTFVLWFLFDHALLREYLSTPWRSLCVCLALCGSVYFAMRLKRDPMSWAAIRMIWFVLFAAVVGPLMYKLVTKFATIEQGPFAFVLFESFVMVSLWSVFYAVKKPVSSSVLFSRDSLRGGAMVGAAMTMVSLTKFAAMHYVDNPGLVPAVKYIDAIIIMAYYRAIGKVEKADVVAGLGIVACAVVIIMLRSV
jgi:uncharacterized membrane protein